MSITALESAIVARLRATVEAAELVQLVYGHQDYAAVPEQNMVTPSLAVIYTGYNPTHVVAPANTPQEVAFGFVVCINVASALHSADGDGVRLAAAPIFDAVLEALLGFRALPKFKPLKLEPAPGAAVSEAGFGYYPIAFSAAATYRGTT